MSTHRLDRRDKRPRSIKLQILVVPSGYYLPLLNFSLALSRNWQISLLPQASQKVVVYPKSRRSHIRLPVQVRYPSWFSQIGLTDKLDSRVFVDITSSTKVGDIGTYVPYVSEPTTRNVKTVHLRRPTTSLTHSLFPFYIYISKLKTL